jgi:hypothetical protein
MTSQPEHDVSEGDLRAYLDDELSTTQRQAVEATLAASPTTRQQLATLQAQAAQVQATIDTAAMPPDTEAAWHRVHSAIAAQPAPIAQTQGNALRRERMNHTIRTWLGTHRALATSLAIVVLLVGLLALPPVRTLADQLLQVFRVQEVVFVPISDERIAELESLDFDTSTLFVGEPDVIADAGEPYPVDDVAAAAQVVGYPVQTPNYLPTDVTLDEVLVRNAGTMAAQVDPVAAQQLLDLLNITDVTIPPELGDQQITVDMAATAMVHYTGADQDITLVQGMSPDVALPDNVDLQQLGRALLRVLGMESQQATNLSQQIDWSTTLVVPMREDIDTLQQVTINGADGLLVQGGHRSDGGNHWQLYWQQGERFYVLHGENDLDSEEIIAVATSVQ